MFVNELLWFLVLHDEKLRFFIYLVDQNKLLDWTWRAQ